MESSGPIVHLERHGATVPGSGRAELQRWLVNMETGTAHQEKNRFRQLRPNAKRLDVKPIARRVCEAVAQEPAALSCDPVQQGVTVWNGETELLVKHGALI
jgi:hypothetical protein